MCRPARMIFGRSSRSSTQCVSPGWPRVADEERAAVAVGDRLLLRLVVGGTAPWGAEPDVAVGVDEAREHPPLEGLHVAPGRPAA